MANTHQAHPYHHAADIPKDVWRALLQNEAAANLILPFAKKALRFPRENDGEQLWIALCDHADEVVLVLSCTKGPLGNYPIFIVVCNPSVLQEGEQGLSDALLPLVLCLLQHVSAQRVFSVFAIAKVSQVFAEVFESHAPQEARIRAIEEPYYDSTFSFCTRDTLRTSSGVVSSAFPEPDVVIALRMADMSHMKAIAVMCKAFSETSWPFVLDDAGAELEAKTMIVNRQVWVHMVQKEGQEPEIACLVATTRESEEVTAVTKVFTADRWRSRGCAARLLHRVCHDVLQKKKRVVLYVGNSDALAPARKVYHKIGFQGLDGRAQGETVTDVERWIEIGFENTVLGYW